MGNQSRNNQQNVQDSALKILICYHKPYTMPPLDDGVFLPIQVGRALTDTDLHIQSDNEVNGHPCDNISDKNGMYCELTAMYWAWKNLRTIYPGVKYVGLFHYRRFLKFGYKRFAADLIIRPEHEISGYKLNEQYVIDSLEAGKVFVSEKLIYSLPIVMHYCIGGNSEDYRTLWEIIRVLL